MVRWSSRGDLADCRRARALRARGPKHGDLMAASVPLLSSLGGAGCSVPNFYAGQYNNTSVSFLCEMIQKSKSRGRPRAYDPGAALDSAAQLFWEHGFADATLDDLSEAMGMGRPSIYNAFGDKESLFLRALERFRDTIGSTPLHALRAESTIRKGLAAFFGQIVEYSTAEWFDRREMPYRLTPSSHDLVSQRSPTRIAMGCFAAPVVHAGHPPMVPRRVSTKIQLRRSHGYPPNARLCGRVTP